LVNNKEEERGETKWQ